jgi:hypothetical protein
VTWSQAKDTWCTWMDIHKPDLVGIEIQAEQHDMSPTSTCETKCSRIGYAAWEGDMEGLSWEDIPDGM